MMTCSGRRSELDYYGWAGCQSLELEPVGAATSLMILEIYGTPGRGGGQVYVVRSEGFLVVGDPVAQSIGVVRWDHSYFYLIKHIICIRIEADKLKQENRRLNN